MTSHKPLPQPRILNAISWSFFDLQSEQRQQVNTREPDPYRNSPASGKKDYKNVLPVCICVKVALLWRESILQERGGVEGGSGGVFTARDFDPCVIMRSVTSIRPLQSKSKLMFFTECVEGEGGLSSRFSIILETFWQHTGRFFTLGLPSKVKVWKT